MLKNRKKLNQDELNINNIEYKKKIIYDKQNKRKKNLKYIYSFHLKLKNKIISLTILFIIINFFICFTNQNSFEYNQITLKIYGTGSQYILGKDKKYNHYFPYSILVNGNEVEIDNKNKINIVSSSQENTVTMIWNGKVTNCDYLFYGCINIIEIDFSYFNTSEVESMYRMLAECESLKSITISNLNTEKVKNMGYLFYKCESLISLDLSSFNTQNVNNTESMFNGCNSLQSLNLNNFDTKSITNMKSMFKGCDSLNSLEISNFDISIVEDMSEMFRSCESLISLNLQNFKNSLVKSMSSMFKGCESLIYLNLINFKTQNCESMSSMFFNCASLRSLDLSGFDTSSVEAMDDMFSGCALLVSLNLSKFNTKKVTSMAYMFDSCVSLISLDLSSFDTSNLKSMSHMFSACGSLKSLDLSNFKTDSVDDMSFLFNGCKNLEFINISKFNDASSKVNNMFKNVPSNLVYCINDEDPPSKILLQLNQLACAVKICSIYWKKYQQKIIVERNDCINDCSKDILFKYEYENRCYRSCPYGTFETNNNQCTKDLQDCPKNFPYKIVDSNQCVSNCLIEDFFNSKCVISNQDIKVKQNFIDLLINGISNNSSNSFLSDVINENKKDYIIEQNDIIYQITSSYNQKNKVYDNISTIDLGECENILKSESNMNEDDNLIILKIDYLMEGLNIPIIRYNIFNPNTKSHLDLNLCNNEKINYNIPVSISINEDDLYIYNPESEYYNNLCFSYNTSNTVDKTLYDRKDEYNINNISLCENNCDFRDYNFSSKKVLCQCSIESKSNLQLEDIINTKKLLNNFINIKSITNLEVIKCYDLLFSKEGLIPNIGSYVLLSIIFLFIILLILFYFKGFDLLKIKINNIINEKRNNTNNKNSHKTNNKSKIKVKRFIHKVGTKRKNMESKNNTSKLDLKSSKGIISNTINNKISEINSNDNYIDSELNIIPYEQATENDKRNYLKFYFSLIKTKHPLIFAFYPSNDYNSREIKICLFLFSFALSFGINTLFYNDSTMHKIYEDEGAFNFLFLLPKMIYSMIISFAIIYLIKFLSLSESSIIVLKEDKETLNIEERAKKTIKNLSIKFICFFIFCFIFLIAFWYYISCFCCVYKKTQLYLFNNTLISFGLSLLYPFILLLLPGIIRVPLLKAPKKCLKFLYNFSKCLS